MSNRPQPARWNRYQNWILATLLIVIVIMVYLPTLASYFVSDDFTYIAWMFFNSQSLLAGEKWWAWLVQGIDPQAFRPGGLVFLFVNYLMWGTDAFGYHVTDILLHIFSSVLAYLIAWRLVRHRLTAIAAAALFALQPTHSGAVSWVGAACYDALGGFLCLTSFLSFVLYRQKKQIRHYATALGAFILALLTKEIALTFPAVILAYDFLYHQPQSLRFISALRTHLLFWLGVCAYLFYRFFILGIFGYKGISISAQDMQQWVMGTFANIGNPFVTSTEIATFGLFLFLCALVVIVYRDRREILLGGAWILVTFFPVIGAISGPSERSFYLASFGLVLILASVLVRPTRIENKLIRASGAIALVLVGAAYSLALFEQNQIFQRASQVAQAIPSQVKHLHSSFEPNARIIFVGVPDRLEDGTLVYITGFGDSVAVTFGTRNLNLFKFAKFPIWLDNLDHTYLFHVDHRKVYERTDLMTALKARQACSDFSVPAIGWDFAQGIQNWEAWNELEDLSVRENALSARSVGKAPILGSPSFDIPSIAIGKVRITMRVRADSPSLNGNVYWLASDQQDFFPGLNKSFAVQADGEFHTYQINLAQTGALLIGDRITQLRFDPVDAPAEIAIRKIEITTHCSDLVNLTCICR